MADTTHSAHGGGAHGHDAHGHHVAPDHHPHILPLWIYYATFATLLVLTVITVGASYVDFGAANLFIALLIATVKASVVGMIFMHLRWDLKFHTVIFASSLVFLFIFIVFTMYDTNHRGHADGIERERPADITNPFGGSKQEIEFKEETERRFGLIQEKPAGGAHGGDDAAGAHGKDAQHGGAPTTERHPTTPSPVERQPGQLPSHQPIGVDPPAVVPGGAQLPSQTPAQGPGGPGMLPGEPGVKPQPESGGR